MSAGGEGEDPVGGGRAKRGFEVGVAGSSKCYPPSIPRRDLKIKRVSILSLCSWDPSAMPQLQA